MPEISEEALQAAAREQFDTTLGDVVNAVRAGTLADSDARQLVALAEASLPATHPELNDDDPDDLLGWCMTDDGPVAEQG